MTAALYLPKLNHLTPTLDSTLLKIMEEAGELARAVLAFLPYQDWSSEEIEKNDLASHNLSEVVAELLDTAQTCVTMIFVMEEQISFKIDDLLTDHLQKLVAKNYGYTEKPNYSIRSEGQYKYLALPELHLPDVTLLTTVCKIQEELGELAEVLGKLAGRSGENCQTPKDDLNRLCALELLDVAQCCCTMMYILGEQYSVDMAEFLSRHIAKLKLRGYFS